MMLRYSVESIYLFGSTARDEATGSSDIDLLVEFDPNATVGLFHFSRLRRELGQLLRCDVDLTTPEALHKDLKADILDEAIHVA